MVRAGDFIFGLPQFDGSNYVVQGGSQGGGLAIIAGALSSLAWMFMWTGGGRDREGVNPLLA